MATNTEPAVKGRFVTAKEAERLAARSRESRVAVDQSDSVRTRMFRRVLKVPDVLPELEAVRRARTDAFDETMRQRGALGAREWAIETLAMLDIENMLLRERRGR